MPAARAERPGGPSSDVSSQAPTERTEGGVAHLRIPSFEGAWHPAILAALDACRLFERLVIDVRGNGGGSTPVALMKRLLPRGFPLWADASVLHVDLDRARWVEELRDASGGGRGPRARSFVPAPWLEGDADAFAGPIAILQDALTTSAAEDFLMPFKWTGRAVLVGETGAGTSGQPYSEDLGDGMAFRVAARAQLFPDGSPFEGVGIRPDIEAAPTAEALVRGKDLALERAREALSGNTPLSSQYLEPGDDTSA